MRSSGQSGWVRTVIVFLLINVPCGCAYMSDFTGGWSPSGRSSATTTHTGTTADTAGSTIPTNTLPTPTTSTTMTPLPTSMSPLFYDFNDIPTPRELSLSSDESYVFEGGGTKAGLLVLRGRVEPGSVMNFFDAALPREQWKKRGSLRYRRSVLVFEKPDRACIINVYEKNFSTNVEIYVIPYEQQQK